jgi:glutamate dehydrogenase
MPLDSQASGAVSRAELQDALQQAMAASNAAPRMVDSLYRDYRPDELPGVAAADIAHLMAGFWAFAEGCEAALKLRIVPARGADGRDLAADLLEIAQPDAPFLVDSVMGEVADAGLTVKAMFHPMLERGGAKVSMIQVWLERLGDDRARRLIDGVREALADVHAAVDDFPSMLGLAERTIEELEVAAPGDPEALAESLEFLRWLVDGHFVFLGARLYDYPRTPDGGYAPEEPLYQPEDSLGVLRDPARFVLRQGSEPAVLSAALRRGLERADPVIVAKSNLRSRVHRRTYMDYVGVHRYGADGKPFGEIRFVGLFTALAYDEPATEVPFIRRKVMRVMERTGYEPGSHNAVRMANILESWPRDELFQAPEDELLRMALGVVHLSDRPKVKLFARVDPFDRFVAVLLYAPRERYDAALTQKAGALLAAAYGGRVSAYYPTYGDTPLARTHFIIGVEPARHPDPDLGALEAEIAEAALTWGDRFEAALRSANGDEGEVAAILSDYAEAFPVGYRDRYDAAEALEDIAVIATLAGDGACAVRLFRRAGDPAARLTVKLYRCSEAPATLAELAPILVDMGRGPNAPAPRAVVTGGGIK